MICYWMHLSRSWFQWTTGKLTALGTFALIVSAHTNTKMNNDRAAIALLGFNDLGRSVTPTFLTRNRFLFELSPVQN